jgi:hypothetical protein
VCIINLLLSLIQELTSVSISYPYDVIKTQKNNYNILYGVTKYMSYKSNEFLYLLYIY